MSFTAKDILHMQVAPALGCTEPVAIALGSSAAASLLEDRSSIEAIEIWLDPNIYKNGLGVIIPGTRGMVGLGTAAILGNSFEKTIQNVGTLSTEGMMEADRTILKIMQAKQAANEKQPPPDNKEQ